MKIRTIILTLVFVLLGVFLVINWNALMTDLPTDNNPLKSCWEPCG